MLLHNGIEHISLRKSVKRSVALEPFLAMAREWSTSADAKVPLLTPPESYARLR